MSEASVDLYYRAYEPSDNVEVAVGLRSLDERPLLYLSTRNLGEHVAGTRNRGIFRFSVPKLPLAPGQYFLNFDVYRNGHPLGRRFVRFELIGRAADAVPCVDASLAQAAGIAAERLPFELRRALSDATHCAQLAQVVPGARAVHDSGELAR